MMRRLAVLVVLSLGLGAAGPRAEDKAAPDADKAAKGQQVYAAQHCSMCHSIAGKGNAKNPLDDVGSKMTAEEIKKYITNPKSVKADSKMKAYPSLAGDDLDALITYLLTLTKKAS
jgi:mono/diheme cytochrome c family protein